MKTDMQKIENLLDELRDVPARDPKLAAQGRAQFLSQAVSVRTQAVSRKPIARLTRWFDKFKLPKERKRMTTFASILAIMALLMGGSAGTVYAAQDSLPNDTLYPVKIASEEFRLNMANDPAEELDLLLEFTERRGYEVETLLAEGEEVPADTMLKLNQNTQQAMQLAGTLDDAAMLKVQNTIQNQTQRMLNLQANASEEGAMLMEQIRAALQNQLAISGAGGTGQGQGQGQTTTEEPLETPAEGEALDQTQGQDQSQGQGQGQDQSQGQGQGGGTGDGSGNSAMTPGSETGQGQQNSNQGVDPCVAYYESLAQSGSSGQGQGGNGKGQGGGGQGTSQGPVVYGLDGQVCPMPTAVP